ncbi:MAG: energy-coupling factor transporter transmembrane component T [Candidatus Syntrophopropionicum ammoniitolerans]
MANLDPRTKMIMVVCLSILALLYNTPAQLFLLFVFTLMLLLFFNFRLNVIGVYLKPFLALMLFLFVVQCVFSPSGLSILSVGQVSLVTSGGLLLGSSMVLRIIVVTAAAMLFTTFSPRDFILGLVQWKVPYELAFMVFIALRFLPVFRDELVNVITAVQLRGVDLKKVPWKQKLDLYRRLFFPVVYGVMLKAQHLAVSMESRGFRAYPTRTYLRRLNLYYADYIVMVTFLAATITLIVIGLS